MKIRLIVLLMLLVTSQTVNANDNDSNDPYELLLVKWDVVINDPNDPSELLRSIWDAVIKVLKNEDIEPEAKEKEIYKIITPVFDFTLMGKLALGKTHWPKLTGPQSEKFTQLFTKHIKDSYCEKISLYTDEKAYLNPAIRKKKGIILIPMKLMSKDRNIDMLYKLRMVDKQWKIYDVEIQGVSIILTYRSQFNEILHKGTVKDILSQLEKPSAR